jgi:tRNA (guanine37-N1)-methyltransferase
MKIDILTLFPKMFGACPAKPWRSGGPFSESIIKRAQEKGIVKINIHNLRDWATDKRKTVDDKPYGGGPGMVMRVDIIDRALRDLKSEIRNPKSETNSKLQIPKSKTILLTPAGKLFNQKKARSLSQLSNLILICGHYEGVDERVRQLVDEEISIGDYVLTGGELAAAVLVDTVVRLIAGVLGKKESSKIESFSSVKINEKLAKTYHLSPKSYHVLEYPQYTRPENYKGMKVPKILLSGDHKKIAEWRLKKSIERTRKRKPDLLK